MGQAVAQLATLVDGAGGLRGAMAADAAGKGKFAEEAPQAILVLGLRYGTDDPNDKNTKYDLYRKTQDLIEQFKTQAGSIYCRDLLGFDLGTPQGQTASKQPGAFDTCPQCVRTAAEIVQKILNQ